MDSSFAECVLWEISGACCVDTKPRSIKATCIISGDRELTASIENLAVTSERGYSDFVCMGLRTYSMTELKLGVKLGVKEGGGHPL